VATKTLGMNFKQQTEFKKKLVGIVDVITSDKSAKFTLTEEGKKFENGTTIFKAALADLPKRPKLPTNVKEPRQYRIRMNDDGDAIEAITPVRGSFAAKLVDLGPRKKDQEPSPYEKWYHKGEKDENMHLEFFAVYEITDGAYKGVQLPAYNLHYKFEQDPEEDGMTRFNTANTPQAKQLHRLIDWGEVQGGLFDAPIEWPDDGNILPTLLERALDADRDVVVIIDKGYVNMVQPADSDEDESDEEFDEKFPDPEPEDGDEPVKEVPAKGKAKEPKKVAKQTSKVAEPDDDDDL
jgi:hypothetical protein